MRDPYEVLSLKKGASKDDVKRAYKKLAKQYHPDQYDDNPLRTLAEEKMREVNEAYDYLMKSIPENSQGNQGSNYNNNAYNNNSNSSNNYNNNNNNNYQQSNYQQNNYQQSNYNSNNYSSGVNLYSQVRSDINTGNLRAAEEKLNSIRTRDAEWNYLMGILFSKKGWYDSARNYLTTAYNMNPSNIEYRNAFNQLNVHNNSYRQTYYGRSNRDVDMCNLCTNLWCADTLCECFGGDLIDCM